jgi:hypothetical protein
MNQHRLAAALQILNEYADSEGECQPGHDQLFFSGPPPEQMKDVDVSRLTKLNFRWDEHEECWAVFT